MPFSTSPVRWAPQVPRTIIYKLYQADARGLVDEDLIDEVGFALYARCQSILIVTAAAAGRVQCPHCSAIIQRCGEEEDETLVCAHCAWETTWARYHQTWRHQELYGGGAVDALSAFIDAWARASEPRQKMRLIDELIHRWHWQAREDHQLGRPVGVNLIEGSRAQVLALLDSLTYGPASTDGLQASHGVWSAFWRETRAGPRQRD